MPASTTDFEIFRNDSTENVTVFVRDPRTNVLSDVVAASTFSLVKVTDDTTVLNQSFTAPGSGIVSRAGTGIYQVNVDFSTYDKEYIAFFRCVMDGEIINVNKFIKSVSSRHFKYASLLRGTVDKARKSITDYIENMDKTDEPYVELFYGYTDSHLIYYLERGCQYINLIPPYTALSVDSFPFDTFGSVLLDAATVAALEAQGIFAIDTDYDYSLGGNSFVIDHFSKLSSFVSTVLERFKTAVVPFKQQYRNKGAVLHQFLPGGIRDMRYLSSLPSGFWSRLLSTNF